MPFVIANYDFFIENIFIHHFLIEWYKGENFLIRSSALEFNARFILKQFRNLFHVGASNEILISKQSNIQLRKLKIKKVN